MDREVEFDSKLNSMIDKMDVIVHGKDFLDEITRFIPQDVQDRAIKKPKFYYSLPQKIKSF